MYGYRRRTILAAALITLSAAVALPVGADALTATTIGGPGGSGGVPIVSGGLAPTGSTPSIPPPPSKHAPGHWLRGATITEYWPASESWFVGKLVKAPGIPGLHRIDWLYSATGISMQGEGIGLDGQLYRMQSPGDGGWVTAAGRPTSATDNWSSGPPFWRAGAYWRNSKRAVTFPLQTGGWSAGAGGKYVPLHDASFVAGGATALRYYQSVAVDPRVIPLGSRVYIPAYRTDGHGGWFVAQDTGGAINGRHIDVYRPPPPTSADSGRDIRGQRIYVIAPRR